ncbi:MAG: hypothetical protein M3O36_05455, partial [Myxococcota bacterium]|nr:hypothetical protein [Myxococcota bacterium]
MTGEDQRDPNGLDDAETASSGNRAGDASQDDPSTEPSGVAGRESPTGPPSGVVGDPLAVAQSEALRMREAWLRTAADFDNFRKRSRRELEE